MKIYDCFIFNDEIDILNLRLHFLNPYIDHFVIVESTRTLSGEAKPLHFKNNEDLFKVFKEKIIHIIAPNNDLPVWEYEYYQRSYIKEALKDCDEDDLIHISDVDEILNLKEILPELLLQDGPVIVQIPMYYYWLNLKTNAEWCFNLVGKWKDIKEKNIGERFETFPKIFNRFKSIKKLNTGWHFSYLFGSDISKYQKKIKDFSHQEFNTEYFLNPKRIFKCITLKTDLFERGFMSFKISHQELEPILPCIKQLGLNHLIFNPSSFNYFILSNILFLVKKKHFKQISYRTGLAEKNLKTAIKTMLKFIFHKVAM